MKVGDYRVLMKKEYEKNRKNIFTCYFFLLLSVVLFAIFFLRVRELPVVGAGFLLDLAAGVYAFRAWKGLHPYWEMGLALQAARKPDEDSVCRLTAAIEIAAEKGLPPFKGRALEIFDQTLLEVRKHGTVSEDRIRQLEMAMKGSG